MLFGNKQARGDWASSPKGRAGISSPLFLLVLFLPRIDILLTSGPMRFTYLYEWIHPSLLWAEMGPGTEEQLVANSNTWVSDSPGSGDIAFRVERATAPRVLIKRCDNGLPNNTYRQC